MPDKQSVKIEDFKGLRVAYLRDDGPSHEVGPPLMRKLRKHAVQHKLHGPDATFLSIINDHPDAHEHQHARVDAAVTVPGEFQPSKESEFEVRELPAGPHAVYRHVGSYKNLREAWAHFASLPIPPGYRLRGPSPTGPRNPDAAPSFEIHRNDPAHTPENELITDLYQPVEVLG